jgi:hypothetical protein
MVGVLQGVDFSIIRPRMRMELGSDVMRWGGSGSYIQPPIRLDSNAVQVLPFQDFKDRSTEMASCSPRNGLNAAETANAVNCSTPKMPSTSSPKT